MQFLCYNLSINKHRLTHRKLSQKTVSSLSHKNKILMQLQWIFVIFTPSMCFSSCKRHKCLRILQPCSAWQHCRSPVLIVQCTKSRSPSGSQYCISWFFLTCLYPKSSHKLLGKFGLLLIVVNLVAIKTVMELFSKIFWDWYTTYFHANKFNKKGCWSATK